MAATSAPTSGMSRLWHRELNHYPGNGVRFTSLGIVVLATIILYYQFYMQGAVATHIIAEYHMSFVYFVNISVIGYILGAVASFLAGVADRYGRANIVTIGLFVTGLLCLFGIPNAHSKAGFGVVFVLIGFVEGIILVATPALIRDFSPQLGRASAMGFWTLGPVLGSLVVAIEVSATSDNTAWQDHFMAAGVVGLVVAVLALLFLRELSPNLRDQLMVSSRDRALLEARAKGIDVEASLKKPFSQMFKVDIVASAIAISVFLIFYYLAVGFFPVFFQTVFGYSLSRANGLGDWFWAFDALALLVTGFVSDLTRVRKPFMLGGAILAAVFTAIFAVKANNTSTSHGTFVVLLVIIAVTLGITYAPWMASFTETVERRNPALTATGLAVWGLIIRIIIAVTVFFVPHVVSTVTTLVDKGPTVQAAAAGKDPSLTASENSTVAAVAADPTIVPKVQAAATKYSAQLATAAKIDPATLAALTANGNDQTAGIKAISEISGVSVADTTTIATLNATHAQALAAGQALDPATQVALLTAPTTATINTAVGEIVAKLNVTPTAAGALLQELKAIPVPQLLVVQSSGTKVAAATAQLTALGAAEKSDPASFQLLNKYGKALQDPKVVASLTFLQKEAPGVQKAAKDSPGQWQKYWWIAVGGEIVFIPLIFVMAGFWDPRKARKQEQDHEAWLEAELAKLGQQA
jgi:MFS transporter, ACS family, D-galactonate transporter